MDIQMPENERTWARGPYEAMDRPDPPPYPHIAMTANDVKEDWAAMEADMSGLRRQTIG